MGLVKWVDISGRFPMRFDTKRMLEDLRNLEDGDWLEHYDKGLSREWKAIPLYSLDGRLGDSEAQRPGAFDQYKPTPLLEKLPYFREVLDSFKCPRGRIRIMKLSPGAGIGEHRDVGLEVANLAFRRVRMHIPIQTNADVMFLVDGERIHMKEGGLYYVNFSKKHAVRNDGNTVRIHLVMDLDVNEWFAQYFPPLSVLDHVNAAIQRVALPLWWKALRKKTVTETAFWRIYQGSRLQRLREHVRAS